MKRNQMDRLLAERIWGIPWSILALAALAVAVVYLVLDTSGQSTGANWVVLRWFHPLCWLLLALAALAMSQLTPLSPGWARPLAIAGGAIYAIFLATSLLS